jgi:hypothetical protein
MLNSKTINVCRVEIFGSDAEEAGRLAYGKRGTGRIKIEIGCRCGFS